ncbi:MAG TPA: alpha/beta fold hydrolase [Verrucomicrobiae bacterium]|nr:alpha/beta fold hydrolase [Verrucomicrobiae bacterium]
MPSSERIAFLNRRGQRLVGIVHRPDGTPKAGVVLCHGMGSSKESEKFVMLGEILAKRGVLALRFDFACSGESEGKFEEITYSGEAEDIAAAYDVVAKYGIAKIGVVGSSMGGAAAILFAAKNPVAALATIAAPVHPEKFSARFLTDEQRRDWRSQGFIVYNGLRLDSTLLEDVETIDVAAAARKIAAPTLVLHGDRDATVPVEEGRELYAALAGPKRLAILAGADHRLTGADLQKAVDEASEWLTEYLLR